MSTRKTRLLIMIIAGIGLILSIYLALSVYGDCSAQSIICRKVHNSTYAYIWGIPVAWIGVLGYLAVGAAELRKMRGFTKTLAVCGFLFELRLVYAQAIVIKVFCPWCMASAFLMTAVVWMAFSDGEQNGHLINRSLNEINYLQRRGQFNA
ncbi:MAG: vitamin K epoxide reductase family protein [Acidobacteriota bacterium]